MAEYIENNVSPDDEATVAAETVINKPQNQDQMPPEEEAVITAETVIIKKQSQAKEVIGRFMKNKMAVVSLIIVVLLIIMAIFADYIAPYGWDDQDLSRQFLLPCKEFLLGTDDYGRDILSRLIYGARYSLAVGLVSVTFSCAIGVILGCIAGFYNQKVDNFIMRVVDVLLAIPNILLALSIATALDPGLMNLIIAVGIGAIPGYARIVRAQILSVKQMEYIEAARSIGASDFRMIVKHILPNCLAPIIVQATMSIAIAILSAASLSFLGLGITPPTPEWGSMLSAGRAYFRDHWHVVTFPGLMIMITVFAFNILGDGLRDALDPKLKN